MMKKQHCYVFFGIILLLISCQTLPEEPYPDIIDWIPIESDVLLRLHVDGNEELAWLLLNLVDVPPEGIEAAMERTALVALGLEMTEDWKNVLTIPSHVVALGRWPRGIFGSVLGQEWKPVPSVPYTWSDPDGKKITVPTRQELLLSSTRLDSMRQNRTKSFSWKRRQDLMPINADFAMLISSEDFINSLIPTLKGRVEALSVILERESSTNYNLDFRIEAKEERFVKPIALALRLGISSQFGKSSVPELRNLLSQIEITFGEGSILLSIQAMELSTLETMLTQMKVFSPKETSSSLR